MKPALGFAGAIVLVVLAVLAALLAADVRAWQTTLREDDALVASTPKLATWEPSTHLASLAEHVLGVSDDVEARQAIALFLETANVPIRFDNGRQVAVARSRAEQALAAVARHSSGPRASQAETLLGVLVFTDVGPSTDPFQVSTGDGSRSGAGEPRRLRRRGARRSGKCLREVRPRARPPLPARAGRAYRPRPADGLGIDRPARRRRRRPGRRY